MLGVEFLAVLHSAEETRPQQEVERVLMQILHPGIHAAAGELTILPTPGQRLSQCKNKVETTYRCEV